MLSHVHELVAVLQAAADPGDAQILARYFQVRPGGYGEGDVFLGIKLGPLRGLLKPYYGTEFVAEEWVELLRSPVHEFRMACLVVMAERARLLRRRPAAGSGEAALLFDTYLAHTTFINNWDLVDLSSPSVVGGCLMDRDRDVLYRLAGSPVLWERRIAMVSTQTFIRAGETGDVYRLAELLLDDQHDRCTRRWAGCYERRASGWTPPSCAGSWTCTQRECHGRPCATPSSTSTRRSGDTTWRYGAPRPDGDGSGAVWRGERIT